MEARLPRPPSRVTAAPAPWRMMVLGTLVLASTVARATPEVTLDISGLDNDYQDTTLTVLPGTDPPLPESIASIKSITFLSHLDPLVTPLARSFTRLNFANRTLNRPLSINEAAIATLDESIGTSFCGGGVERATEITTVSVPRYVNDRLADFDAQFAQACLVQPTSFVHGHLSYREPALLAPDLVTVSGRAWNDADRSGFRGPSESGLWGVKIRAHAVDPVPAGAEALADIEVRTDILGNYTMHALPQTYQFVADCPPSMVPTITTAPNGVPAESDFTTAPNALNAQATGPLSHPANLGAVGGAGGTVDLGCHGAANVIDGHVWLDANRDGVRQSGEEFARPMNLMRFNADTQQFEFYAAVNTDARGRFQITVPDGRYQLDFIGADPGNHSYAATRRLAGGGNGSEQTDSDLDLDGKTPAVDVQGGGSWFQFDVGLVNNIGAVSGKVWRDINANGLREVSEVGIADVPLSLLKDGEVLASTVTNASGVYNFSNVIGGQGFQVRLDRDVAADLRASVVSPFVAPGSPTVAAINNDLQAATLSTPAFTVSGVRDANINIDVGLLLPPTGRISGVAWQDTDGDGVFDKGEPPATGAPIWIFKSGDGAGTLGPYRTASNGRYSVSVPSGSGYLLATEYNAHRRPALRGVNGATDNDFGSVQREFSVGASQTVNRDLGVFDVQRDAQVITNYWPLHVGASWTYVDPTNGEFTLSVVSKGSMHGRTVYRLRNSRTRDEYLLSIDAKGLALHGLTANAARGVRLQGTSDQPMSWASPAVKFSDVSGGTVKVSGSLIRQGSQQRGTGTMKYRSQVDSVSPDGGYSNFQPRLRVSFSAGGTVGDGLRVNITARFILERGIGPTTWLASAGLPGAQLVRYHVDVDGDGIEQALDNCPLVANADQNDRDGDGVGDKCDLDNDDDRVLDKVDNCRYAANSDQRDSDHDGHGDVCDL